MDPKLLEACMSGDEQVLQKLIRRDPLILDRAVITCCEDPPLHVAVLRGHLSFVRALLGLQRELASERDASGCVPLHLASAKGSVEIVRELLSADAELCRARDNDGRTPLHLAIMKGRSEVVKEFIRVCPRSASERLDSGETVFHLSIKTGRFEALKMLVESFLQLLAATDDKGNTVLHCAAFYKQTQMIRFLLRFAEVREIAYDTNNDGHTALDVVQNRPRDLNSFKIVETLTRRGLTSSNTDTRNNILVRIKVFSDRVIWYFMQSYQMDWIADAHGNLMVVATVIASIAFQAGLNPPGGVWQEDTMDNHTCTKPDMCRAGTAVFKDAKGFNNFYSHNSWALLAAVSVVLVYFGGLPLKNKVCTWVMTITTCLMLHNIMEAYVSSTCMVVKPSGDNKTLLIIGLVWRCMFLIIVYMHTLRMWYWLLYTKLPLIVSGSGKSCMRLRGLVYYLGVVATPLVLIVFIFLSGGRTRNSCLTPCCDYGV